MLKVSNTFFLIKKGGEIRLDDTLATCFLFRQNYKVLIPALGHIDLGKDKLQSFCFQLGNHIIFYSYSQSLLKSVFKRGFFLLQ